jgi:hypothetical protein
MLPWAYAVLTSVGMKLTASAHDFGTYTDPMASPLLQWLT